MGTKIKIKDETDSIWASDFNLPLVSNLSKSEHSSSKKAKKRKAVKKKFSKRHYNISSFCSRAINQTYPADCREIAAVDSNKHDWDWNNRYWKKRFLYKNIF